MIGPLRNVLSVLSDYTVGTAIVVVFLSTAERRMRRLEIAGGRGDGLDLEARFSARSDRARGPVWAGESRLVGARGASHEWNV